MKPEIHIPAARELVIPTLRELDTGAWPIEELGTDLYRRWTVTRPDTVSYQPEGRVDAWKDSVTGEDMVQASENARPFYRVETSPNGIPAISTDGTSEQKLELPGASGYLEYSMFMLFKPVDNPQSNSNAAMSSYRTVSGPAWQIDGNNANQWRGTLDNAFTNLLFDAADPNDMGNWLLYSFDSQVAAGTIATYKNGVFGAQTAGFTGWEDSSIDYRMFVNRGNNRYIEGIILDWIFCASLTDRADERQMVEGALAHSYGLTSLLDPSHPYKNDRP